MSAYIIVQIDVKDPERYDDYRTMVPPTLSAYGGRFLVRGGKSEIMEGTWLPSRLVVLEFPSTDQARAWWSSQEYAAAKRLRQHTAETEMILVEGA